MDLKIFEKMDTPELKNYIQFLLWHYRVMDSFWYLYITEKFGQPVADELNEMVLSNSYYGITGSWIPSGIFISQKNLVNRLQMN